MRARFIRELEKRTNNNIAIRIHFVLEAHPYADTIRVISWLADTFKSKLNGTTQFADFDVAIKDSMQGLLSAGDKFYTSLFRSGKFINRQTKALESTTPYTDAVRRIYRHLFTGRQVNEGGLTIYSELRALLEHAIGKKLADDPVLQTYEQWQEIDNLLEVEHEIASEWLDQLSMVRLRAEQVKFLTAAKSRRLSDIAILDYSYQNREKAAKQYSTQLRKLSKKSAFGYVESAVKSADLIHFTPIVSLQERLARRMGIKEFVTFVDQLKFPIAQHHAFFYIDKLEDYLQITKEICSRRRLKTPKEYLLLYALKNYYGFVNRTLNDLEYFQQLPSYLRNKQDLRELRLVQQDARMLLDNWKSQRIKESFDAMLTTIFPKSRLSSSKYFIIVFDWLNSYSKLYLTHPATSSQRELIDLLNESFQERLNSDSVSYHYLADQLPQGSINQEGLKKLLSVLTVHPEDAALCDKLYHSYLVHLKATNFHWHADGNVDNIEAINHAYYFSQVICAYADAEQRWLELFETNRIKHEGWYPSPSDTLRHQQEAYLLCVGIGMAHFRYTHGKPVQATTTFFDIVELLLKQLRSSYDRSTIDYETPLWFAGATIARFAPTERERFINLICQRVDALKLFLRVVYEFFYNSVPTNLTASSRTLIQERLLHEFFIIESSKVDAELRHDLEYYKKLKQFVEDKLKA